MSTRVWLAEWAWLGGDRVEPDVLLKVDLSTGLLTWVQPDWAGDEPPDSIRLPGLTLPGLVNTHSHAFHRALRGRTHGGARDFWSWRDQMYAVAERLDPDHYFRLARAVFAEMALAGITLVGEFHYLHHGPGGVPYADPNTMAEALRAAADAAGVRITLLDTLYLRAGFDGGPLHPAQRRFSDGDADRWAARVEALATAWTGDAGARVGCAVHSVRAVDPAGMKLAAEYAAGTARPVHVHVSEQPAENDDCQRAHGCSPTQLLADSGLVGPRTTAVHATHPVAAGSGLAAGDAPGSASERPGPAETGDLDLLASSGAGVCLCPTTERELADGIGPARAMAARGIPLSLGSDSHAVIDLFEEARAAELDERLASGTRGGLTPTVLLAAATANGAMALGWPNLGRLAVGHGADFVTVRLDSVRLAGLPTADLLAGVVFAATASDVTDVVVGGRPVVQSGHHVVVDDVPAALYQAITHLDPDPTERPAP